MSKPEQVGVGLSGGVDASPELGVSLEHGSVEKAALRCGLLFRTGPTESEAQRRDGLSLAGLIPAAIDAEGQLGPLGARAGQRGIAPAAVGALALERASAQLASMRASATRQVNARMLARSDER